MRMTRVARQEKENHLQKLIEVDQGTQKHAAGLLGVSVSWVERACKRLGLKTQRSGPRSGPLHPDWRGGRMVDRGGYVLIWCPDHLFVRKTRYVLEHRLVMERMLGRYLKPNEVVHHINGVRDDNRPENLQVFQTNGAHLKAELEGKVPNWTDEGCERMEAGIERSRRTRFGVKSDARQRNQRTARLKEKRGSSR